jgi:uncharacterized glyoxalase superfamily protein PhnB
MNAPPAGWPRISASVYYDDAHAAIDWLCTAFGFELRLKVEGEAGRLEHSELAFAEGLVMVGNTPGATEVPPWQRTNASPRSLGGKHTQSLCLYVDDVDALFERAVKAGATVARAPATNDHGDDYWTDRSCGLTDPEGHLWWFMQRLRGPKHAR